MQKTELLSTSYSQTQECSGVKVTLRADEDPRMSAHCRRDALMQTHSHTNKLTHSHTHSSVIRTLDTRRLTGSYILKKEMTVFISALLKHTAFF